MFHLKMIAFIIDGVLKKGGGGVLNSGTNINLVREERIAIYFGLMHDSDQSHFL